MTENIATTSAAVDNQIVLEGVVNAIPTAEASSHLYLYLIALVVILAVLYFARRKSRPSKKQIALVGERGSGKTQLFIGLCGGKSFETVPSISNNTSTLEIGRHSYLICDYIGDNLSKEEVLSQLPRFHTIVLTVDGCDSKKLSDAAIFIYRLLVSKKFQQDPCELVLFFNKADERSFHGQEKLSKRIEDQIQTIKSSRRNLPEQNQTQEDYLRNDRTRFDLKKQGVDVLSGSARNDRAGLVAKLEQLCS